MKNFKFLIAFCIATPLAFSSENAEVEKAYMYYKLRDFDSAETMCMRALDLYPDSAKLQELQFRIFSEKGNIEQAIAMIKEHPCFQEVRNFNDLALVEELAWGVLTHVTMSSEAMQLMAMIGAFFTNDARAVNLILKHLMSSNALLRAHAVRATMHYRDDALKDKLKVLLCDEKNYFVKLEVIKVVGLLQMEECSILLKEIIASEISTDELKCAAIQALVQIYESMTRHDLLEMINSPRAGLRLAACEIAAHLEEKEHLPDLVQLLDDSSPEVKVAALNAVSILGLHRIEAKELKKKIEALIEDANPAVSVTAEWLNIRHSLGIKQTNLKKWLYHDNPRVRLMTASAMGLCGHAMEKNLVEEFHNHTDPFVRLNLAIGLIHIGKEIDEALGQIHQSLEDTTTKMMKRQFGNPLFTTYAPSEVRHVPFIPQYPDMVDQLTRLELINTLTILNYPGAKEMLKRMLKNETLHVVGNTASLLLEEGELESIDLVRELVEDPDHRIATQAALVLAFLGKDPSVVPVLIQAYHLGDWELKIQILEALGRIGDYSAIPFLIEVVEEPFQLLKIVAASSLIQCLYH